MLTWKMDALELLFVDAVIDKWWLECLNLLLNTISRSQEVKKTKYEKSQDISRNLKAGVFEDTFNCFAWGHSVFKTKELICVLILNFLSFGLKIFQDNLKDLKLRYVALWRFLEGKMLRKKDFVLFLTEEAYSHGGV